MEQVEAYIAVEITTGPHLVEETLKDGSSGFRNIVCWLNGQLPLSNDNFVKGYRFGFLGDERVPEDNSQATQVEAQMETGRGKRFSQPSTSQWPCYPAPQNCEGNRPQDSEGTVQPGSTEAVKIDNGFYLSRWSDQEIYDTHLTEGQKAHLEKIASSSLRKAWETKYRETNLRTFRQMEMNDNIPKRFLKKRGLGAGLLTREKAIYQVDCRIPRVRPLKHILAAFEMKQVITATMVSSDVEANAIEEGSKVSSCDCSAAV